MLGNRRRSFSFFVTSALIDLVTTSCGGTGFSPPPLETAPDDAIEAFITLGGLPAVAVAVVDGGETLYAKVAGVRKRGSGVLVADDDAFLINSNTKSMTALVAGTVVDAGQISLNSTVASVLTGIVSVGAPYREMTLTQLFDHSSGLPDRLPDADWATFFTTASTAAPIGDERRRMAELALAQPPAYQPGSEFLYTGFGYLVGGLMVEVASGMSWETLLHERLFAPLGMAHAGFGYPATPSMIDAPWGHDPAPRPPDRPTFPRAYGPSYGVHANVDDLLRYARLYFDRGLGPNGPIISETALTEIETPRIVDYYGFGWFLGLDLAGRKVLSHLGSDRTFSSSIVLIPERRAAVIVMTNLGDPTDSDDEMATTRLRQINSYLFGHFLHCDGKPSFTPPRGAATIVLLSSICLHDNN